MNKHQWIKVAQDSHFFDKHHKVLVAVSAGLDSVNLLELLYQTKDLLDIDLGIVHINHHQREASAEEENFVQTLSKKYSLPIYIGHFRGDFSEEAARTFRYQYFKQIMESQGYTALVTAHHRDDQAETIVMRFIRGSRLHHLTGIAPVQPFGPGELIRPLLTIHKSELEDLFHYEDASNKDLTYFRNRVRHLYLPALQQENPQITEHLIQFSQELSDYKVALQTLTQDLDPTDLPTFRAQIPALQRILLTQYVEQFPDLALTKDQFDQVHHILLTKANYQGPLKNGYFLTKDYSRFAIQQTPPRSNPLQDLPKVLEYQHQLTITDQTFSYGPFLEGAQHRLTLSDTRPITIRRRQPGDRILLNGHTVKLSRYLINQKIPLMEREKGLVLQQGDQILAYLPWMISDLSKSPKDDIMKTTLYIKWKA